LEGEEPCESSVVLSDLLLFFRGFNAGYRLPNSTVR